MKAKIHVDAALQEGLRDFVTAEGIAADVAANGTGSEDAAVTVRGARQGEHLRCDARVLYVGGWISCEAAHALARRLDVSTHQVGRLIELLDVKVRHCELGCF